MIILLCVRESHLTRTSLFRWGTSLRTELLINRSEFLKDLRINEDSVDFPVGFPLPVLMFKKIWKTCSLCSTLPGRFVPVPFQAIGLTGSQLATYVSIPSFKNAKSGQ